MKNKGFTLVELITTFALASVIIVMLMNIVVIIKNIYFNNNTKTELIINQGNLSKTLNSKLYNKVLNIEACEGINNCFNFILYDGEIKLLISENTIKLDNTVIYYADTNTKIGSPYLTQMEEGSYWNLRIPITNKVYSDDFGINLVIKRQ